jgi:hypothetical protein
MGLLQSYLVIPHYIGRLRELASLITALKRDLNSTVGTQLNACSSAGSTDTSSGINARSNSQMSAQFRRALGQIKSGAFGFLRRDGS